MKTERVFVYGTLKKAYGNHRIIAEYGGVFVGDGVTKQKFPLTVQGIPYLHDQPGKGHHVHGEVWEVPAVCMVGPMDQLEGHGRGFYNRQRVAVTLPHGDEEVWAYFICRKPHDTMFFSSYEEGLSYWRDQWKKSNSN